MSKELSEIIKWLKALESTLEQKGDSLRCDLRIAEGDWGGRHVLVSLSPWSAAHIARQLVQLIERDFSGAHFDIDKAGIALETPHQICFSLDKND